MAKQNDASLIQESEARGPLAANFPEMDCDKNGGLDQDEIKGFFTGAGCPEAPAATASAASAKKIIPPLGERAKPLDANDDNLIQESEARGPLAANFPEMDCDKNGGLDQDEIRGFFTGAGCPEAPVATASAASTHFFFALRVGARGRCFARSRRHGPASHPHRPSHPGRASRAAP